MYTASLHKICRVLELEPEMRPFVEFQANMEKRRLSDSDPVAMLVIEGTGSYRPLFLEPAPDLEALKKDLETLHTKLDDGAQAAIQAYIRNRSSVARESSNGVL